MNGEIQIGDLVTLPLDTGDSVGVVVAKEVCELEDSSPIHLLEIYFSDYGLVKIDSCYVSMA